jgi:catechol 2,3-dioxygenase-like lactoylglutathione lyase family enzyme
MPARTSPQRGSGVSFHSVALVVSDRRRSVEWYTTKLGLDVIEGDPEADDHWIVVGRTGETGGVHLCDIPTFDPAIPVEPGESGIQFDLPGDFRRACASLRANGVRFVTPPTKRPWGWFAKVVDPDGNELRLNPAPRVAQATVGGGDPSPERRPSRSYLVRVALPVPLSFAYRWCTDYSRSDGQLSGEGYQRRILGRSDGRVTFEDLYDAGPGWIWIHRVVRLAPPDGWDAESIGSDRAISVRYRLTRLTSTRTQLTIQAQRRPYGIGTKNPPRELWETTVAENWKRFGRAMERDYAKRRPRTPRK